METKEKIKLNLGCRNRDIPGFKGMDLEEHAGVDFVGDVADLSRFEDGSVEEIYSSNILEHFPHVQTASVLKEWYRVLGTGGILYLSVPDFRRAMELYMTGPEGLGDWIVNFLWGDQVYPSAFHYAGFDFRRLSSILKSVGFTEISQVGNLPVGHPQDCSRNISSFDKQLVSLNVVAIK